jgi:hypothetical protein
VSASDGKRPSAGESADGLDQYLDLDILDVARRYGDWGLLASYIMDGGTITEPMRAFLADVLLGNVKRPNNRPQRATTFLRSRLIAEYVLRREATVGREAAIGEACERFGTEEAIDRRTVQRALKMWQPRLGRHS